MNFRKGIVSKRGIKANYRLVQVWFIILLNLIAGGFATLSAGPADPERIAQTFSGFIAVVAKEGDTFSSLSAEYLKDPSWDWFLAEFNEVDSPEPGQPLIIPLNPEKRGGLSLRGYQTVPILCYHKFSTTESKKLSISQEMFEQQMRFLRDGGYRVISMDQLFDFLEFKRAIPPKSVVITIDDGWLSAHEIAFPILKKYGYSATLFVYTDIISNSSKTLSWNLLQEMTTEGIDVQCHTKSLRKLTLPGKKESFKDYFVNLEKELSGCKDTIKKRLNLDVKYLAYPYGVTNSLVIEMAKKLGYRGALTINPGGNPFFVHNFRLNRSEIYGEFTPSQFEKKLLVFQEQSLR